MKRILSIITAGCLALAALSCVKEEDKAIVDLTKATPPVLLSGDVADNVTVKYTPGVFDMSFNQKMKTYHTLALLSVNNEDANITLSTKDDGNTLTLTGKSLTNVLKIRGFKTGDQVSLAVKVRASIQDPSRGITNAYVDSENSYSFFWTMPEEAAAGSCPYEDYTEASTWSLIGAIEAYGINWDGDLNMWTDGNGNHVAAHVTLKAGDEVKFRKDQDWAVNMGGDFGGLDSEFAVSQDGPNIKVGADGVYDLFLFESSGTALVTAAFDPFPDYTESSAWSVIGALSLAGINWDGDIAMVSDGSNHAAFAVALAADDEFKFRKDASWGENLGGDFAALDEEFGVTQDGPNIKVGAAGVYDLFVNPDAGTATVSAASGLKVSAKIGGETPGPGPQPVTGWNIIGLNGDWENDILATNEGDLWTAFITAEGDTEFKWRKDGAWEENYGGVMEALGQPFEAVAGGENIKIGAGFYMVVLDVANLTITVSDGNVWSLIGDFNGWAADVDMVLTDGKWVSPVTKLEGGFKIRHNHDWAENVGGAFVALGEPFEAVAGGDNITVEAGSYVVTYDPEAGTIVVDEVGWGLVGTINEWGGSADIILKEEGLFLVAKGVALTDDDEIKIRYKQDWAENRGGITAVGVPVKAVPGGDNIKPGAGTYDVYYRPDCEVIIVTTAGAELSYWGVVGTINGWGAPDLLMYKDADGKLLREDVELNDTDEIKIRLNEDWAENRGGTFAAFGEPFAVEANGSNIKLGRAAKVTVIYDAEAETITLEGEYTGEAPSAPEHMYMNGGQWGGDTWDWAADTIVELVPVWGAPGYFWCTRWFDSTKGFKFCSQKAWVGDFPGSDCYVEADGLYTVLVNGNNQTVEIMPAEVYGLGDVVFTGGWDFDTAQKFDVEGDKFTCTTSGAGELRIASKVTPSAPIDGVTTGNGWIDWWKTEFIFFDDYKIDYRGAGPDQARVQIEAGKKISIDFNAGTVTVDGEGPQQGGPANLTIDGDPSDWIGVADVISLECPADAEQTGLVSAKLLYGDKLYILVQLSDEAIADGKVRLHVYFDTDDTGCLAARWNDNNIDYMLEGKMTNSGAFVAYSSAFYKFNGALPTDWGWDATEYTPTFESAGNDHWYELAMDYSGYPGGLPQQFNIGLDVVNSNWAVFGFLPQTEHMLAIQKH